MRYLLLILLVIGLAAVAEDTAQEQRYSIRCNSNSALCWQDPQRDAYDMSDPGLVASEAARYCDELVLGDYDDWRLPNSDELRAIIEGNPATEPGGQCLLTMGGDRDETLFRACEGGDPGKGPGDNGCYMKPWLTGSCNKPGPPVATQFLEHWASNRPGDDAQDAQDAKGWQAYVSFDRGALGYNHVNSAGDVRCVRASGSSFGMVRGPELYALKSDLLPQNKFVAQEFDPTKRDACAASDRLILNIRVPEPLTQTPDTLMVFFYRADKWKFPPAGPPDGGTDYNTIKDPAFSEDGLLTTTLPGCTFYRENMLEGEYRVFVQLMMESRRPPMVAKGDYYWGSTTETFTMPLNGTSHRGASRELDITLWPVVN